MPSPSESCREHGTSAYNDVALAYACQACGAVYDAREARHRDEVRARRQDEDLRRRGLTGRLERMRFENFDVKERPDLAEAEKICLDFARKPEGILCLLGDYGTGKTHLGAAIAHRAGGTYTVLMDLIRGIRSTYKRAGESEWAALNRWGEIPLLILDEIGVQRGTSAEMEMTGGILDQRYRLDLPTVLISNESRDGLEKYLGRRIMDRLAENGRIVVMAGESRRRIPGGSSIR